MTKLLFAHQLRALAAISVLLSHTLGTFWHHKDELTNFISIPKLPNNSPILEGSNFFYEHIALFLGQFGVGLFFLISGFVIPFSLYKRTTAQFIIERFFRIYPVYIVGFSITLITMLLVVYFWNGIFQFSLFDIFLQYTILLRELFRSTNIDGISWTLDIEIKFYLLYVLLFFFLNKKPRILLYTALLFSLLGVGALLLTKHESWINSRQPILIMLMYLGISINYYYTNKISRKELIMYYIVTCTLFMLLIPIFISYKSQQPFAGYLTAILIFSASYQFRKKFLNIQLLNHLADISYPMYIVHAWVAYMILYSGIKNGLSPLTALLLAYISIYILSLALHRWVESRSIILGRNLSKKFNTEEL